jgi:hypothetical protein
LLFDEAKTLGSFFAFTTANFLPFSRIMVSLLLNSTTRESLIFLNAPLHQYYLLRPREKLKQMSANEAFRLQRKWVELGDQCFLLDGENGGISELHQNGIKQLATIRLATASPLPNSA